MTDGLDAESSAGSVSIVIPCFNLGEFLAETVDSIEAARTDSLREVIVVDDGSTDRHTIDVFGRLQGAGYTVIRQPNRGPSAARNAGIRIASGDYILPVDSDNRIRRPYLTDAVRMLDADPSIAVVYGDVEYFGEKSGIRRVPEFSLLELVVHNYIDCCALFRKQVWADIGGFDEKIPGWEDWDFWLRAALRGWRFVHLPQVAYEYRVRPGSLLQQHNARGAAIDEHMFSKAELAPIAAVRAELVRLWNIEQSAEYRLGQRLLAPARRFRDSLAGRAPGK